MVKVIAWPPVGAVGSEWTTSNPVQVSKSLITGKRVISAWGRARRKATVIVSALSRSRSGAGYSEMLKQHLDGGMHLVRLNSYPINWHLDQARLEALRSSQPFTWTTEGDPLAWTTGGEPLTWITGTLVQGEASGDNLAVTGLPPNTLIARPGDFVQAFAAAADTDGPVAKITAEAVTDASGAAVLRLFEGLPAGSYPRVNIGASESAVFAADDMPRAVQGIGQNWTYEWRFTEVFENETDGFDEVNPWI